jgi:UDP-N-acetylmuramoyl-L-alanyl-D-glutamate--2,6-diaminopimelate ligase
LDYHPTFAEYRDVKKSFLTTFKDAFVLTNVDDKKWCCCNVTKYSCYKDLEGIVLLAIYGTAVELGMDSLETLRLLSELESVSGRFNTLFRVLILRRLLIMLIL